MKIKLGGNLYYVDKTGFFGKIIGLMFSKKRNLLFELNNKKIIIHSFFVFFPIQLYFLDEEFKIIDKVVLNPFWFYFPKVKARYLVEIPLCSF